MYTAIFKGFFKAFKYVLFIVQVSFAMKFDAILVEIGEFGWYQRRVYLLMALMPSLLCGAQVMSVVFTMAIPHYRCVCVCVCVCVCENVCV